MSADLSAVAGGTGFLPGAMALAGGLALFLFGMDQMTNGLKAVSGGGMRKLLGGLTLIFSSAREVTAIAADPRLGDMLGVASGFTWSFTVIGLRWMAIRAVDHDDTPEAAIAAGCLVATLIAAPFAFPVEASTPQDWLIIAYLGIFQIGLAYVFIARGVRELRAIEVSLLLLVEPVLSPLWTWMLLGEVPAALAMAGGALVLGATAVHALQARDARPA